MLRADNRSVDIEVGIGGTLSGGTFRRSNEALLRSESKEEVRLNLNDDSLLFFVKIELSGLDFSLRLGVCGGTGIVPLGACGISSSSSCGDRLATVGLGGVIGVEEASPEP